MDLYIFIADAWGAKYGGINSFNYDLVIACSRVAKKNSNTKICCVVPCLSKQENEQMLKDGIIPITISKEAFKSPEAAQLIVEALADNSSLRPFFPNLCNSFCIGHDIYTGKLSKQIATKCDGWNIVFHHMDYRSYYLFKNADTVEFEKKEKEQESVLCDADLVCAVGPKLTESAEGITRCKEDLSVIEVYPGFANIKAILKPDPRYRPIVFGRIEHDNQRIKQTELAVDAFAKAISLDDVYMAIGADATISVVGYDRNIPLENEVSNLQKKTEVIAGRLCNVLPIAYLSRNELASTISKASVAMMLSFHEGFGLVGYEAIAAGVPLILSKNTGLYAFLEREGFLKWVYPVEIRGSTEETGYSEADLRNVAIALRIIRLNETQYKEKALILRDQLRSKEKYTWDGVAQRFIESVHTQFETELDRENTAFYRPEQMTKLNFPAGKKTDEITHIIIPEGNHTFVVSGKDALISLYFSVKDHFGENYSVLLYDVPAQMEESCFYSDFLNDCRSFFGKEQDYKGHEFKYQLAERLNQTILIINNYTLTSCSPFFDLLGLLNKSKYNFNIFIVNENDDAPLTLITYDEHAPLELNCTATPKKLPATLTRDEKLILKILSFCDKIGYSKKLVSYICRGIAQYHDSIGKPIQSESLSEIGRTLLEKGLIEEFSAFSYKNVDSYLQEAGNLKPDEVDYAVGISKLGQFYGRCYRLNRGRNPLLRWGYFSCRCFAYAAKLNEEIKGIIKLNYESVLSEMRKNAMDMSDYERYYNTIRAFMEEYKEPNNPWIWYNYLHCESIIRPSIKVLRDIEHVLTDVISMLDNSDLKRTDLYIQFIRLSAEIEFELDYPDVIKKAENRIIQYSIHEETGIAWEQYLSTIVNIAIGEKEYDLAKEYLNKYKERNVYDNPYHQVISTALESELKIVQYGEDKGINLKEILPAISNVFFLAQNTLRDYRAQGWIVGLWGECQVLLKDQNGEGNILKSIEHRKISKEKTKSYCNWLSRVATYELTEETNKAIIAELNRICEDKIS